MVVHQRSIPSPSYVYYDWFCSYLAGDYNNYIKAFEKSNPTLRRADPENAKTPIKDFTGARVVLLESFAEGTPKFEEFLSKSGGHDNLTALEGHLARHRVSGRRRIYIMEGLAKQYIAVLAKAFYMPPTFWQQQERTTLWSNESDPPCNALPPPSFLNPERHVCLQYCELREFNKRLGIDPQFCSKTNRHVGFNDLSQKKSIAIVRRKISWWFKKSEGDNGWDSMCQSLVKTVTALRT